MLFTREVLIMQVSVYGKYMHTLHEHSMSLQYVNAISPAGLVTNSTQLCQLTV